MKKINTVLLILITGSITWAQENSIMVSSGYSFANVKVIDDQANGWRINGLYEFSAMNGRYANGIASGYLNLQADENVGGTKQINSISAVPLYYTSKITLGNEGFKFFVKVALGLQFTTLKSEGAVNFKGTDTGFYGGGGGGFMFDFGNNLFITAEYEIAWVSTSYYADGWLNSAMGGIGFRF